MRDYVTQYIDKKWNNSIESGGNTFKPIDIDQAKLSKKNRQYNFIEQIDLVIDERENKYEEWFKKSNVDK